MRLFLEAPDHGRGHVAHGHGAGEQVGVGKQISFERLCLRIDGADQRGVVGGDGEEVFLLPRPAPSMAAAISNML